MIDWRLTSADLSPLTTLGVGLASPPIAITARIATGVTVSCTAAEAARFTLVASLPAFVDAATGAPAANTTWVEAAGWMGTSWTIHCNGANFVAEGIVVTRAARARVQLLYGTREVASTTIFCPPGLQ